jgi:PAS domain S-box-containing protein
MGNPLPELDPAPGSQADDIAELKLSETVAEAAPAEPKGELPAEPPDREEKPAEAEAAKAVEKEPEAKEDEEGDKRLGGIIHILCVAISLGLVLCMIHPLLARQKATVGALIFEELALVLVLWFNGQGRYRTAMRSLVLSLLATVTALAFFRGNGIDDTAMLAFPMVIVVSSLFLNRRWFVSICLATIGCFSLIALNTYRQLPPTPPATEEQGSILTSDALLNSDRNLLLVEWVDAVVILGLTSLLVGLITQYLKESILSAKAHEKSLAQSNADLQRQADHLSNYSEILDGVSEAILVAECSKGRIVEINRATEELFGFTPEELYEFTLAALCTGGAPLSDDKAAEWTLKAVEEETQVFQTQCWTKRGDMFWAEVELRGTKIGGERRLLGVIRDYSTHRKAEMELRESEARFFCLAQASFEAVAIVDDGIIVAANDNFTKMLGYESDAVIGMKITDLMPEEAGGFLLETDETTKEARYETEALRKDGNRVPIEIRGKSLPYRGRVARVAAIRDVSERKSLQEQFRQAQKMEAFGQLAGGVAHDFNNLLTVIISHAAMLKMKGAEVSFEEQSQSVQEIAEAAERATNLTRQLLTFSRRQQMQRERVDLNEVVRNMTKMLKRILGEKIALQANCLDGYAPVYADSGMLEQVLLNLAVNSRDAMPNGGYLIIQTDVVQVPPEELAKHNGAPEGNYIRMSVSDTGCGISPENLQRIFEPFFTTKAAGKGTGLGLATVFGIVEQHQGWVEVQSTVGSGTTFMIFLPQGTGSAIRKMAKQSEDAMKGGSETILLAEDEEGVRELTSMVLKASGYNVLEASDAYNAYEIWQQYSGYIDMLFTDVIMPGDIGGRALAERLVSEKPSLKVIFCSGYTDETLGVDACLRDLPNFLPKPFDLVRLTQLVRSTLDGTVAASQEVPANG